MPPCLETCPDLVIEEIVQLLGIQDIQNLRLTSKAVSYKASNGKFRRSCQSKHVDLSNNGLQLFTDTLYNSATLPPLKQLYLVGLLSKENQLPPNPDDKRDALVKALVRAFNEIAKRSKNQCLALLILEAAVVCSDGTRLLPIEACDVPHKAKLSEAPKGKTIPRRVWSCATNTWRIAQRALAASQLRVESLNGFNMPDMLRCSIPCDQLDIDYELMTGLTESLKPLKSLSLSICDRVFEANDKPSTIENYLAEAAEEVNFIGLSKLIKLCSQLECLDLHYFHMYNQKVSVLTEFSSEKILKYVVELDQLPRLEVLTLRGLPANGADLLDLITRTTPGSLSLQNIVLRQGTFAPIFAHCRSDEAEVKALSLASLYEGDKILRFEDNQQLMVTRPECITKELLGRDAVSQQFWHVASTAFFIGSPWTAEYRRIQRLEYG